MATITLLFRLTVISVLFLLPAATRAEAGSLAIFSPPDHACVEGKLLDLVLTTGGLKPDVVSITVNGRHLPPILNPGKAQTLCREGLQLLDGINTISVVLLDDGRPLASAAINVFRRSNLSWRYNQPPPGFTAYSFHTPDNENKCRRCHLIDLGSIATRPPSPEKSPCFLCHKQLLQGKFAHGPASVWACLMCHAPESPGARFQTARPSKVVCAGCHGERSDPAYPHGPVAMGMCTACHDPHVADHPFFLRMETTDLCSSCHEDTANRPHVISYFSSGKGHPVYLKKNPFQPGQEFTCASCHQPHGGAFPFLLKKEKTSMKTYCTSCHEFEHGR